MSRRRGLGLGCTARLDGSNRGQHPRVTRGTLIGADDFALSLALPFVYPPLCVSTAISLLRSPT